METAQRELLRVYLAMRKVWVVLAGLWIISALYVTVTLMILDTAEWNISTAGGYELAPLMLTSCLLVIGSTWVLSRFLLNMIPMRRMKSHHLWPRDGIVSAESSKRNPESFDEANWEELIKELHRPVKAPDPKKFE